METKKWFHSRTLWLNAIAFAALAIQSFGTGFIIAPEEQAGILVVLNIILRVITKQGLGA